ncbi:MAG: peptidylprolyl isomerase [Rickettsiales bacterium]
MKNILIFIMIFLVTPALASEESIVAVVNNHAITKTDVQKRIDFIIKSSGFDKSQANLADLKHHVISMVIDELLIEDDAKANEIKLDDMDLKFAFESLAEKNGVHPTKFDEMLKARGVDKGVLEKQIANQILMSKIIKSEIHPRVFVSDKEVSESKAALIKAINDHKEEKVVTKIKIAEIVLYPESNEAVKSEMNLAQNIVKQARGGKNFSNLANEFSQSPTAENGGVIGWVYANQMRHELLGQLIGKDPNFVTDPIFLEDGIHIIKLLDVKYHQPDKPPVSEVDDETLKDMLFNKKLDLQIKNYIRKLRKNAYIRFNE